eukprot:g71791.t1
MPPNERIRILTKRFKTRYIHRHFLSFGNPLTFTFIMLNWFYVATTHDMEAQSNGSLAKAQEVCVVEEKSSMLGGGSLSRACVSACLGGRANHTAKRMFSATAGGNTDTKDLYVWGDASSFQAAPFKQNLDKPTLVPCPDGSGFKQICFGDHHGALVTGNGAVQVFGTGKYHELGLGEKKEKPIDMTVVPGLPPIKEVGCGELHTIALATNGEVYTWGWGGSFFNAGALGHEKSGDCAVPTRVKGLDGERIVQVASGKAHCLALTEDGRIFAWGNGEYGRLGTGSSSSSKTPTLVTFQTEQVVVKIATGSSHNAALTDKGELFTWGRDDANQCGMGAGMSMDVYSIVSEPTLVEETPKVADISCGTKHTHFISEDGHLWWFGRHIHTSPHRVQGYDGLFLKCKVTQVVGGNGFTACRDEDGYVYTLGCAAPKIAVMCNGCVGHVGKASNEHPEEHAFFGHTKFPARALFAGPRQLAVLTDRARSRKKCTGMCSF